MSLQIAFDGLWDSATMRRIESALRSCIGEPPGNEEWTVAVTSFGSFCVVFVKAAQQTRRKVFFVRSLELAEAIPEWLGQYPLR